jgi:hypothetical protein
MVPPVTLAGRNAGRVLWTAGADRREGHGMMSRVSAILGGSAAPQAPHQHIPPAVRITRPGWRDPRLWIGVLIVAVSVVVGARALAAADDSITVWAAARDMGAGDTLSTDDLVAHRVRFGESVDLGRYFATSDPVPSDLQLLRGVGEGELLPRSAVGRAGSDALLQLPVAVDGELVPPSVSAGSVIDLYVLPSAGGRCAADCGPVLQGVTVISASTTDEGFGASGQRQLVLGVADADAKAYFAAHGSVDSPTLTVVRRG